MKKLFLFPLMLLFVLAVSCSGDNDGTNVPEIKSEVFYGSMLFNGSVVDSEAKCSLDIVGDFASVTLYGVSFAPAMPAMDIVIPELKCEKNGNDYVISGKNVVPLANGAPVNMFKMSVVEATLTGGKFVVNATTTMGNVVFTNALLEIGIEKSHKIYSGVLAVGEYKSASVVEVTMNAAKSIVDIVIAGARFSANMPLAIDITLKDIPYLVDGDALSFSVQDVAPYINTEPEPAESYMFASVNGSIVGDCISFDANMADDLAPYVAGKRFVFEGTETVK